MENMAHGGGEERSCKDRSGQRTGEHLRLEGTVSLKAFVARATHPRGEFLESSQSWWGTRLIISSKALS